MFTKTPQGNKHSCLDHIFVKINNNLNGKIEAGVLQTNSTDHYSTLIGIQINNQNQQTINNVYNTINNNKLNEILMKVNWNKVYINNNVNECFNVFIYVFIFFFL